MVGRHMNQPGTGISGNEVGAIEEGARLSVEFAVREFVGHRMLRDGTG